MRRDIRLHRVTPSLKSRTTMPHNGMYIAVIMTIILVTSHAVNTTDRHIHLVALLPTNGSYAFSARKLWPMFDVAIHTVERELLPGYQLSIVYGDSGADIALAPHSAYSIYRRVNISAFLGPVVDDALAPVAMQARIWGLPIFTTGGVDERFDDRSYFSTLVRLGFHHIANAILKLMADHGWKRVKLLYTNTVHQATGMNGVCNKLPRDLRRKSERRKGLHVSTSRISGDYSEMLVTEVGRQFAIVVLCAPPDIVRSILRKARQLHFENGHYAFIVVDLLRTKTEIRRPWFRKQDSHQDNTVAMFSYKFVITIAEHRPLADQHHNVLLQIKERAAQLYGDRTFYDDANGYIGVFYDAVVVFAKAINDTIADGHNIWNSGEILSRIMSTQKYVGMSGSVSFGKDGTRYTEYAILDMVSDTNGIFHAVATYYSDSDRYEKLSNQRSYWDKIRDTPECSYDEQCDAFPYYGEVLITLFAMFVVGTVITYFVYIQRRTSIELRNLEWRIYWENVVLYKRKIHYPVGRKRSSTTDGSDNAEVAVSHRSNYFVDIGFVNGVRVSIKFINRQHFTIDKIALIELKRMMDIEHDHICRFVGVCIDAPNQSILSEYCQKGSLRDVLENDRIALDWVFRFSLVHDIAKGMSYIHSSPFRSHGDLNSMNCLVTSRFVLKITDFGLHFLRDDFRSLAEYARYQRRLWTAPELLRMLHPPIIGTQKGDVYSFAMICQEIVYRKGIFYVQQREYMADGRKYNHVKQGVEPYFRPTLEVEDCSHQAFYDMVIKSWSEDPDERLTFNEIIRILWKLNSRDKMCNLLDNLLTRMETYANDLETIVKDRSAGIIEEKERADNLLHLLLPKSVAEKLSRGEHVPPESYDSVTIFLSDIIGFTALAASCTPMDTVDLLNDLYTLFDSIIGSFDVYKIETIGDAYMTVSGLPVRNGIAHAAEIARMALAIHCAAITFRISFRPEEEELQLRIGVHSGPVWTGVLGNKMPRYCLIGRTVMVVGSYESTGNAQMIHISGETKELLDEIGGFVITRRGEVEIPMVGKVTTYWLIGGTFAWDTCAMPRKGIFDGPFPPGPCPTPPSPNVVESFKESTHKRRPSGSVSSGTSPNLLPDHELTKSIRESPKSFAVDHQTSLTKKDRRIITSMQNMLRASVQMSKSGSHNLLLTPSKDADQATSAGTFSTLLASDERITHEAAILAAKAKHKKLARFRNSVRKQISPVLETSFYDHKPLLPTYMKRLSIPENRARSTRDNRRRSSTGGAVKKGQVSPQSCPRAIRVSMMNSMRRKRAEERISSTIMNKESWESKALHARRDSRRRSSILRDIQESAKHTVPSHIYSSSSMDRHHRPRSPKAESTTVVQDYTVHNSPSHLGVDYLK